MRINITNKEKESLRFIVQMFLETHEQDKIIYPGEIAVAKKIIKRLDSPKN